MTVQNEAGKIYLQIVQQLSNSVSKLFVKVQQNGKAGVAAPLNPTMLHDIGAPGSEFGGTNGSDTLIGNDSWNILRGGAGNDVLIGQGGLDFLLGGTGRDTADYSYLNGTSDGVTADLSKRVAYRGGELGQNGDADILSSIENLIGSKNNDKLTGNARDNIFYGGGGQDRIDGRGGYDIVQLEGRFEDYSYSFNPANETLTVTKPGDSSFQLDLLNIERLQFRLPSTVNGGTSYTVGQAINAVNDVVTTQAIETGAAGDLAPALTGIDVKGNDQAVGAITIDVIGLGLVANEANPSTTVTNAWGTLTLEANDTLSFVANGSAAQALGEGQTQAVTYYYFVNGTPGESASVTITIRGTNDGPVIVGAGENLVQNGSFEMPYEPADGGFSTGTPTGWTVLEGSSTPIEVVADGHRAVVTPYGREWIDTQGSPGGIHIGQTVSVDAGSPYVLSVSVSKGSVGGSAGDGSVLVVRFGGVEVGQIAYADLPADGSFQTFAFMVDGAAGGSKLLSLQDIRSPGAFSGLAIDNVSLVKADAVQAATVTENAATTADASDSATAAGSFQVSDLDQNDSLTVDSFLAASKAEGGAVLTPALLDALKAGFAVAPISGTAATVNWTYALADGADSIVNALPEGGVVTLTFNVEVTDSQGASVTQPVTITVRGTNDAPVVTSPASQATGKVFEAGDLDNVTTADTALNARFEPNQELTAEVQALLAANPANMGAVLSGVVSLLPPGAGLADAIAVVWDYIDDNYSYYNNAINEAAVRLGVEYAGYLKAGGKPLLDVVAKFAADGGDAGSAPDRLQSLHDNLLGNLHGPSIMDKLAGAGTGSNSAPVPGLYQQMLDLIADRGLTPVLSRPIFDGNETSTNESLAWDQANGLVPAAAGQLTSSDVDTGATATWSGSATSVYGAFTISPAGAWTYVLNQGNADGLAEGDTVTETFTATVTDDKGATATQVVTITIVGSNDKPVITTTAGQAEGAVREAGDLDGMPGGVDAGTPSTTGQLTSTDVDTGATATWTGSTPSTYGTFTISAAGVWTYVLNQASANVLTENQTVTETFTATVTDDKGAIATQTVTVVITGSNDAPVITGTSAGTATEAGFGGDGAARGQGVVVGQLSASDVDAGAMATWSLVGSGNSPYGCLSVNQTGQWTYTLDNAAANSLGLGDTRTETFTVRVTDEFGATDEQTVTITIVGSNDGPVAVADTNALDAVVESGVNPGDAPFAGDPTATGNVLANDTDVDAGDSKTVASVGGEAGKVGTAVQGTYGSVTIAADGTYTYTLDNANAATQAHAQGETGTETFTYTVSDTNGLTSTATLTVTITGTNDAPVIAGGTGNIVASAAGNGTLAGAQSLDGFFAVAADANVTDSATIPHVTVNVTGEGQYEWFKITVIEPNSRLIVDADGPFTFDTWARLYDSNGVVISTGSDDAGSDPGSSDGLDTFLDFVIATPGTYYIKLSRYSDSEVPSGSITTLHVSLENAVLGSGGAAPAGLVREAGLLDDGSADAGILTASGTLAKTDVDSDDNAANDTWSLVPSSGQDGSATALTGTYGSFVIDQDGGWTYTLDNADADTQALAEGVTRTETFTVKVTDSHGASDTQTVTITITGTNDAPVLAAETAGPLVDTAGADTFLPVTGTLADNASDVDGDALTFGLVNPQSGTSALGTLTVNEDGTYSYVANAAAVNALGAEDVVTETFNVYVSDAKGAVTVSTLTVTINGANDAPIVQKDPFVVGTIGEDQGPVGPISLLTLRAVNTQQQIVTDAENDPLTFSVDSVTVNGTIVTASEAGIVIAQNGSVTFTTNTPLYQSLPAGQNALVEIVYRASDGSLSDTGTLRLTVQGANDIATISGPAAGTVTEDGAADADATTVETVGGTLVVTDVDAGQAAFKTPVTLEGTYGTFSFDSTSGVWSYTLDNTKVQSLAAGATFTDTLTVESLDGTASQAIVVTISGTNDAPVIGSAVVSLAIPETDATLSATGNLAFSDVDSGDTPEASVTGRVVTASGLTLTDVQIAAISAAFQITPAGAWAFNLASPDFLAVGDSVTAVFTVTVTDDSGATAAQDVTITLTGTNDAPVINSTAAVVELAETNAALSATGQVVFSDVDFDDTPVATVNVANATLTASGIILTPEQEAAFRSAFSITNADTGTWTYSLPAAASQFLDDGDSVTLTYSVVVTDDSGATAVQNVTITVTGTNDAPVLVADTASITENEELVIDVLSNDGDIDSGDVLTLQSLGTAVLDTTGATFSLPAGANLSTAFSIVDGKVQFNPGTLFDSLSLGEIVRVTVPYSVSDGTATSTSSLTVTITGTNDAPYLVSAVGYIDHVVNGSFETPDNVAGGNGNPVIPTDGVTGWTPVPTSAHIDIAEDGARNVTSPFGGQWLDSEGTPIEGANAYTGVKQSITSLTEGQTYRLSFWYHDGSLNPQGGGNSNSNNGTAQNSSIQVLWNGTVVSLTVDNMSGTTPIILNPQGQSSGWYHAWVDVVANANTLADTVEFRIVSRGDNAQVGIAIDNVQLFEPTEGLSFFEDQIGLGQIIGKVTGADVDGPGAILYSFAAEGDGGGRFIIDQATGEIRVKEGATFDFETEPTVNLQVRMIDGLGSPASVTPVEVQIRDANEAIKVITKPVILSEAEMATLEDPAGDLDPPLGGTGDSFSVDLYDVFDPDAVNNTSNPNDLFDGALTIDASGLLATLRLRGEDGTDSDIEIPVDVLIEAGLVEFDAASGQLTVNETLSETLRELMGAGDSFAIGGQVTVLSSDGSHAVLDRATINVSASFQGSGDTDLSNLDLVQNAGAGEGGPDYGNSQQPDSLASIDPEFLVPHFNVDGTHV